jgi:hypothetical protein
MTTTTGSGGSSNSNPERAVQEAIARAKKTLGPSEASYGLLFASPKMDLAVALSEARRRCKGTDFLGCTTAGEITEAGLTHGGLSVMLVASPHQKHTVRWSHAASPAQAAEDLGRAFFTQRKQDRSGVGTTVVLVDGLSGTGETVVDALRGLVGGLPHEIVGGAAGDEGKFAGTFVGVNAECANGAVAALHVVDRTRWGVGVDHGLSPVTAPMRVTRAEGSIVHELDGRPAFEVYKDYAKSKGLALTMDNAPPFFLNNELGVIVFDQLKKARAPLAANPDGSLLCAAGIPQGASVCFLGGTHDALVSAARRAATEAKERLGAGRAAGVLLFDCICRGGILGPDFHREIQAVRDVFPDVPIAGFLTYGEIARYSGHLDGWHNTTAVVVAIPA